MSNTLTPNPDMITLDRDDMKVWQYPNTPDFDDENPAAQARAEHIQHEYVEALAAPEPVSEFETVPAANESHAYATASGNAIDPAHSEAVLAAAQASVADAFAADPDLRAMQQANEVQRLNREQHAAAVAQAAAYAPRIDEMRDSALIHWGANNNV